MLQRTSQCAATTCQTPPASAAVATTALGALRLLALPVEHVLGRLRREARRRATCRALAAPPRPRRPAGSRAQDIGVERAQIREAVLDQEREHERARLRAQAPSGGIESL